MGAGQPKKLIIIYILDILNKHTDAEHKLSAKEIIELLRRGYDIEVDRKAVKRNLMDLVDFGYDIEYSETTRVNKSGEEEIIYSDWYLNHKFEPAELRLLIDSLLFSKHIPYSQCKELIGKLTDLASSHFKANVKHVYNLPERAPRNPELFYTIEVLDEAIAKKKQVSFNYTYYWPDKKKHMRSGADGEPTLFHVTPYQMVATNGRYYLVCSMDKYDTLGNYRVDRITNISITGKPAKPKSKVKGMEHGFDLPKHMAEHIYMFHGDSVRVRFRAPLATITDVVDWFGLDFDIKQADDEYVNITVLVNEQAMFHWAMQYGTVVEVLSPKRLRERIAKAADAMSEKYICK